MSLHSPGAVVASALVDVQCADAPAAVVAPALLSHHAEAPVDPEPAPVEVQGADAPAAVVTSAISHLIDTRPCNFTSFHIALRFILGTFFSKPYSAYVILCLSSHVSALRACSSILSKVRQAQQTITKASAATRQCTFADHIIPYQSLATPSDLCIHVCRNSA